MARNPRTRPPGRQQGITLVEVMVGITLGMFVSAALLMLFARTSTNGQNVQRASVQIENGRYVSEMLREDLQLAGFFGELATKDAAWSEPDPCATTPSGFTASPLTLPTPVRGYASSETLACLSSRNRLSGTDALVVRRLATGNVAVSSLTSSNSQYLMQVSFCSEDSSSTPLAFDRQPSQLTLRNRACAGPNVARAYVSRIYFIASCNVCGTGGDSTPTLKRLDLVGNQLVETPLVDGVEALRFEYGFDTDLNGSVDAWRTSPAATGAASQWQNVMALKVHYVVRSLEKAAGGHTARSQSFDLGATGTYTTTDDGYVRRAYSMTNRLINPSGARELQ